MYFGEVCRRSVEGKIVFVVSVGEVRLRCNIFSHRILFQEEKEKEKYYEAWKVSEYEKRFE